MSFFDSIIKDLREKRLWPVAVVLLAGLVAVPMLLSKSAAKVPRRGRAARLARRLGAPEQGTARGHRYAAHEPRADHRSRA